VLCNLDIRKAGAVPQVTCGKEDWEQGVDVLCHVIAAAMLFVQFLLVGWVESKRWADLKNPGSQGDGSFLGVTDELKGQSNG
jgi:hypothetical protein